MPNNEPMFPVADWIADPVKDISRSFEIALHLGTACPCLSNQLIYMQTFAASQSYNEFVLYFSLLLFIYVFPHLRYSYYENFAANSELSIHLPEAHFDLVTSSLPHHWANDLPSAL